MVMKIGELAQQAGCSVETIRYYEREGLLPLPGRTAGNYRHYDAAQLERLQLIRRCRSLDMTHDEIRTLLGYRDQPERDCDAVNVLIDEHIAHVRRRIAELVHRWNNNCRPCGNIATTNARFASAASSRT
jgi:Cd(II)/Pb(II)-responsive transcriptional regulator